MSGEFTLFGPAHLGVLAATAAACWLMVWLGRADASGRWGRRAGWVLAAVLVAGKCTGLWVSGRLLGLPWEERLPMHLCDWGWFCLVVVLLWRQQALYELAFFWGLAGTFQAVLTPDLDYNFPHPLFVTFFISHCGLVVGVIFLTLGAGMRPRRGSVWRTFAWSQVYALAAGAVNVALGTNYGYLCAKPQHASLMDYLGPWPWYILALEALALGLFGLLHAPFFLARRARERGGGT